MAKRLLPFEVDQFIQAGRDRGYSRVECIRSLAARGFSLAEAKQLVHDSPAWADRKDSDERFWDELLNKLEGDATAGPSEDGLWKGRLTVSLGGPVVLAAFVLLTAFIGFVAYSAISTWIAQDDCLDAGGVWRDGQCLGRRPGG